MPINIPKSYDEISDPKPVQGNYYCTLERAIDMKPTNGMESIILSVVLAENVDAPTSKIDPLEFAIFLQGDSSPEGNKQILNIKKIIKCINKTAIERDFSRKITISAGSSLSAKDFDGIKGMVLPLNYYTAKQGKNAGKVIQCVNYEAIQLHESSKTPESKDNVDMSYN